MDSIKGVLRNKPRHKIFWRSLCVILGIVLLMQTIVNQDIYEFTINDYRQIADRALAKAECLDEDDLKFEAALRTTTAVNLTTSQQPVMDTKTALVDGKLTVMNPCPTKSWNDSVLHVSINRTIFTYDVLEKSFPQITSGGRWEPKSCFPSGSTAIIIPYRDRDTHFRVFLNHMHAYLQRNQVKYQIFIVHQVSKQTFNRAKLMNVGFVEAQKLDNFTCYVFHDVDLLPVVAGVPYNCSSIGPLHMVAAMDKYSWNLPYGSYFGGVCAFTPDQYQKLNGFSNRFWGWGGEDDDGRFRVRASAQKGQRVPKAMGHYSMIRHGRDPGNNPIGNTGRIMRESSKGLWKTDGLNSLNYTLLHVKHYKLYTELYVDLLQPVLPIPPAKGIKRKV